MGRQNGLLQRALGQRNQELRQARHEAQAYSQALGEAEQRENGWRSAFEQVQAQEQAALQMEYAPLSLEELAVQGQRPLSRDMYLMYQLRLNKSLSTNSLNLISPFCRFSSVWYFCCWKLEEEKEKRRCR